LQVVDNRHDKVDVDYQRMLFVEFFGTGLSADAYDMVVSGAVDISVGDFELKPRLASDYCYGRNP
jgi:hypothetical protein